MVLLAARVAAAGQVRGPKAELLRAGSTASEPELDTDKRVGVVVYAPPKFSGQLKCESLVESIRSQGRWGGHIYLITEQLKCYQHERWTQCGLDAEIIALNDSAPKAAGPEQPDSSSAPANGTPQAAAGSGGAGQQQHNQRIARSGLWRWWHGVSGSAAPEVERAWLVRTQLWQLLQPPPEMQALVYVHGCEQLVGAPLLPFVQEALATFGKQQAGSHPMLVVAPPGAPLSAPPSRLGIHMGSTVLPTHLGARTHLAAEQQQAVQRRQAVVHEERGQEQEAAAEEQASQQVVGQGAVWVLHRQHSAGLLEAWREAVRERRQQQQQQAQQDHAHVRMSRTALGEGTQHLLHRGAAEGDAEERAVLELAVSRAWLAAQGRKPGPTSQQEQQQQRQRGEVEVDVCARAGPACVARHVQRARGWSRELGCDVQEGCGIMAVPAVFNYVPLSVCGHYDHEMVADWMASLDLCVVQDLGWCLPTHMQPFAKGWLPYPQCAKLELGLSRVSCQWSCTEPTVMRSPGFRTSVIARNLTWP